jgi:hypothetical protein
MDKLISKNFLTSYESAKSKEVWVIIPARGGSKGIPKKNIIPIQGKPLIVYTIEAALHCDLIDRVIVSTDDPKIAKVAEENGAWVPELRPAIFSTDTSLISDVYWHAVDTAAKKLNITPEKIIVLYPTSLFRPPFLLEEVVRELDYSISYKICQQVGHHRGYFIENGDGYMHLIYSGKALKNLGLAFGIRYFPPGFRPRQKGTKFQEYLSRMHYEGGGTSLRLIDPDGSPWSIDIDEEEDIILAQWFLSSRKGVQR